MEELPSWAMNWERNGKTRQVSRGLNLALKLESKVKLPLLLADIAAAQPKIIAALESLSFLHFARFVPSWDRSALMVITEFDGPLEPYVMDFVIALGDVFDTILEYVDPSEYKREWLPVRHHPDEFWAFVQQWNRVPFGPQVFGEKALFPSDFDYPVYSAYPHKTVIDIAGPRPTLPPPVIDRPAAPVDLGDVQGNILRGYRASKAAHLFFSVIDVTRARKWISSDFVAAGTPWGGLRNGKPWSAKPEVMANIAFTHQGLQVLLPKRKDDLDLFPQAFRDGAHARKKLTGDLGDSDPDTWKFGKANQQIHVVVMLYAFDSTKLGASSDPSPIKALTDAALTNGLKVIGSHEALALPNDEDYFGYRDAIAEPRVNGLHGRIAPDMQPASSPGEFLLGSNYASIYGGPSIGRLPSDIASNGTFGALRLMEQHVQLFNDTITAESARLQMAPDLLKAKLMGRWPDGEPISPYKVDPKADTPRNDFDYAPSWEYPNVKDDHDGQHCPVGSHIRRANPRSARVAGQRHARRLIRRGMTSSWSDGGTTRVGMLGLFLCASLERQFEFIQREWLQGGLAASGIRGTQDPIAGIRDKPTRCPIGAGQDVTVPPLVTTRGMLYLFFPSVTTVRGLEQLSIKGKWSDDVLAPIAPTDSSSSAGDILDVFDVGSVKRLTDFISGLESMHVSSDLVDKVVEAIGQPQPTPSPGTQLPGNPLIRPLDPTFVAAPFDSYRQLRNANQTVVWVPEHGAYWVLGRSDAAKVLSDSTTFSQQPKQEEVRGLLTMDPPRHTAVRQLVAQAFAVAGSRVKVLVEAELNNLIPRLEKMGQFDFVAEVAQAIPRRVYWRLYGPGSEAACNRLAETAMRHFGQPERESINDSLTFKLSSARLALEVGKLYLKAMTVGKLQASYKDTLLKEIADRTSVLGTGLTPIEGAMTLVQLSLVHMSSQFLLGSAARNLLAIGLNGRSAWSQLAAMSPNALRAALQKSLDEARRIDPPVTLVERYTTKAVTLSGVDIPANVRVSANLGSANRDGFPAGDGEMFDWTRSGVPEHLSLGHGIHQCIGASIQDTIVTSVLERLIPLLPDLRLRDEDAVPAWLDNIYFRCLQTLPVIRLP